MISQDQYLRITCEVYEPSMVLNKIVPPEGKVITFGEPRGFYIERDYLWGDPATTAHSYEQLKTPRALLATCAAWASPTCSSTRGSRGASVRSWARPWGCWRRR